MEKAGFGRILFITLILYLLFSFEWQLGVAFSIALVVVRLINIPLEIRGVEKRENGEISKKRPRWFFKIFRK